MCLFSIQTKAATIYIEVSVNKRMRKVKVSCTYSIINELNECQLRFYV